MLHFECDTWQAAALKELVEHKFVAWSTGTGVGKCLSTGEEILLANGVYYPIESLVNCVIPLISFDKNTRKQIVTTGQVFDNGIQSCVHIKTKAGCDIVRTKNHPLLSQDAGWMQAGNLSIGQKVAVPLRIDIPQQTAQQTLSDAEIKIAACLIADGDKSGYTYRFTQKLNPLLTSFRDAVEQVGGHLTCSYQEEQRAQTFRAVGITSITEKIFGSFFGNSYEKSVPPAIFSSPLNQIALFLNHLFGGDGCIENRILSERSGKISPKVSYCSVSKQLIKDVKRLLLRFGIPSIIRTKRAAATNSIHENETVAFELHIIRAKDVLAFIDKIGIFGKEVSLNIAQSLLSTNSYMQDEGEGSFDYYTPKIKEYIYLATKLLGVNQTFEGKRWRLPSNQGRGLSRVTVESYAERLNCDFLRFITADWIGWDEVVSVEDVGDQQTYGITVPETNVYVNDLLEHNTALLAVTILHFLSTRPFPKVPCTAPTQHQLFDVLWAEIAKWLRRSEMLSKAFKWTQTKVSLKGHEEEWFAVARTSRPKPGELAAEGLQGFHADNILFVVDEASPIEDPIFNAIDGAFTTAGAYAILASNPTRRSGYFYRTISDPEQVHYKVRNVDANSAKAVTKQSIDRIIGLYGKDSDYYRVKVLGIPPLVDFAALISDEQMYAAHAREILGDSGLPVVVSCDPARFGDDDSTMFVRKGSKVVERISAHGMNTMTIADIVVNLIITYTASVCLIDVIGIGAGVVDRVRQLLKEKKYYCKVIEVNVAEKAENEEMFANRRAEMYWHLRTRIDSISLPGLTPLLDEEAVVIKYSAEKKIQIQKKEELKSILGRSPNDADSLALLFYNEVCFPSLYASPTYFQIGEADTGKRIEEEGFMDWVKEPAAPFGAQKYSQFRSPWTEVSSPFWRN